MKQINIADFETVFGEQISPALKKRITARSLNYEELTPVERDSCTLLCLKALLSSDLKTAGEHRIAEWEAGWGENERLLGESKKVESILPKYFGKYPIVRWKQSWVKATTPQLELELLSVLEDWLFEKFITDCDFVYEFGCGTGHNLLRARQFNQAATLFGLDWVTSSQRIIEKLRESGVDSKIFGRRFDFFHPDKALKIMPNSAVYTIAALEQVGKKFGEFVNFLLEQAPKVCFHVEPIAEVLDETNLLDSISIEYFKKRNYLSGFLDHLRDLEKQNKLKIHFVKRSFVGSLFIDGYTMIAWEPTPKR